MKHFAKIVNGLNPLTILAKRSILDIWRILNMPLHLFVSLRIYSENGKIWNKDLVFDL